MNLPNETEQFCIRRFADLDPEKYIYHNLTHTKEVVEACKILARNEGLSQKETELVIAAAWFHDIGYTEDYMHHEEISKKIATEFLSSINLEPDKIAIICGCIDATRIPQTPGNKLEEVLCDADMYHLTFTSFCDRTGLLRLERNLFLKEQVSMMDFLEESVRFLQAPYFTEYAKNMWSEPKAANLEEVSKKILHRKAESELSKSGLDYPGMISELKDENKILKRKLSRRPMFTRGVDTMFRTTSRKQINLSAIADNKSNILITMNTLIISVVITLFVRRYQDYPQLIIPVLILILTCLGSLVASILSTRPIILKGEFKEEDIRKRGVNLLFFGNFFNTAFSEYDKAMKEMMNDEEQVYTMMIMDQYSQGKVLAKKFKLLRIAYDIFMYGFIVFIITCTLVMILYQNPA